MLRGSVAAYATNHKPTPCEAIWHFECVFGGVSALCFIHNLRTHRHDLNLAKLIHESYYMYI